MAEDVAMEHILNEAAAKEEQKAFVYMVKCEDGSLYTGITKDLKKRMREHYEKSGKGAKYTRSRGIVSIMMVWEASDYSSAARLEYGIKHLMRRDKLKLIASPEERLKELLPKLSGENYIPRREYIMDIDGFLEGDRE